MLALGNYSLRIVPASARATINKTTIKQYTHFAGHFDGHRDAVVRYRAHRPMEEVQGLQGCMGAGGGSRGWKLTRDAEMLTLKLSLSSTSLCHTIANVDDGNDRNDGPLLGGDSCNDGQR